MRINPCTIHEEHLNFPRIIQFEYIYIYIYLVTLDKLNAELEKRSTILMMITSYEDIRVKQRYYLFLFNFIKCSPFELD